MKRLLPALVFVALTFAILNFVGCAGTQVQRTAYTTTDAVGTAVDAAWSAFDQWEITQAKAKLGASAPTPAIKAWIMSQPEWTKASDLLTKYSKAYSAWCNANAALAAGTNAPSALANPSFQQDALAAATELTTLLAQWIPSIKIVK